MNGRRVRGPFFMAHAAVCGIIILCVTCALSAGREKSNVESLFYNGIIYTMDEHSPRAGAIAVGGGRIIEIGETAELLERAGRETIRYDLGGRAVIPGLVDAHAHFIGYARTRAWLNLIGTGSLDDVVEKVAREAAGAQRGGWIIGRGWDQNDWRDPRYPDRGVFDAVAPDNPVYLVRVCGHAAVVNGEALRLAGITGEMPDPEGGRILRDGNGDPTGVLIDEAMTLVKQLIPTPNRQRQKQLLVDAARVCLETGLVGVHEMGVTSENVSIYRELYDEGALPFRITAYYLYDDAGIDSVLENAPLIGYSDDHFSVVGVKLYCDGSLGARSAALLDDYSDDPGNRGLLVASEEELFTSVLRCHTHGFQVAIHAIGDRGNRIVLNVLERAQSAYPRPDARHRIEHAQVVSPVDIPRFAVLGVIPSMQFTHCTSDMPWAEKRLGRKRLDGAYAWRSLLSTGCRIPGGSDFPVESINPFLGIYAAVTRRSIDGMPEGGWMPQQCLTIEEAVRSFTVDAAYAAHQEHVRGKLSAGYLADFVVLTEDIMSISPSEIPRIEVLATVVGGSVVYRHESFSPPARR